MANSSKTEDVSISAETQIYITTMPQTTKGSESYSSSLPDWLKLSKDIQKSELTDQFNEEPVVDVVIHSSNPEAVTGGNTTIANVVVSEVKENEVENKKNGINKFTRRSSSIILQSIITGIDLNLVAAENNTKNTNPDDDIQKAIQKETEHVEDAKAAFTGGSCFLLILLLLYMCFLFILPIIALIYAADEYEDSLCDDGTNYVLPIDSMLTVLGLTDLIMFVLMWVDSLASCGGKNRTPKNWKYTYVFASVCGFCVVSAMASIGCYMWNDQMTDKCKTEAVAEVMLVYIIKVFVLDIACNTFFSIIDNFYK